MEWTKPEFSKSQVSKAGRTLLRQHDGVDDFDAYSHALAVINNWRTSHSYPLNTFKVTLRRYAEGVDPDRLVAQRIKRLSSIEAKLQRFPGMALGRMQDIGGCRAIVQTTDQAYSLWQAYKDSGIKHKLDSVDDYIARPKESGYRGIHLIYKYNSDKKVPSIYNGLNIEIQIRTKLQHAWATAVETVGTFLQQALKSSQGADDWLRFFALMSSVIAIREKSESLVPNVPGNKKVLIAELRKLANKLRVKNSLGMYHQALRVSTEDTLKGHHYYLLRLEPSKQSMTVTAYRRRELDEASADYLKAEREIRDTPGAEAVLVSVDSMSALRRAYPNYFLDTEIFLNELARALR
ncbi:MAG: RelA/SpoT domain-containing protein [Parvibaculum sp.]|nr:RelA/SpoT domain-containing protein [Parvibaculum sp.]